jgi:hypothetical protein
MRVASIVAVRFRAQIAVSISTALCRVTQPEA